MSRQVSVRLSALHIFACPSAKYLVSRPVFFFTVAVFLGWGLEIFSVQPASELSKAYSTGDHLSQAPYHWQLPWPLDPAPAMQVGDSRLLQIV